MANKLSRIPVFYTSAMLAKLKSFSPSAQKPEHVLAAWQAAALPLTVNAVTAAMEHDLCLAHDPAFVRGVLDQTVENGFGDTSPAVAASLPYTTGAMIAAAVRVDRTGSPIDQVRFDILRRRGHGVSDRREHPIRK